ncbi:prolyl 3-hydroxylase 1-like [Petromyzon marinus]|uniref:prolyl 3-hydroxylase 1-like n=1 Tax=Petromyzon marinus TaxID=7757 RepID=UPI003F6FC051
MSPLLLLLPPLLLLLLCSSVASLLASPGQEPWGSPGSLGAESLQPVDVLYASGVDAYGRDDWPGVIRYMNLALRSARAVRAARLHCRRSCDGTNGTALPGDDDNGGGGGEGGQAAAGGAAAWPHAWDARFFGALLRRADCLRHCERVHLGGEPGRHRVGEQLVEEFRRRAPYHYLQMAYFQTKALGRAAACAHTFHVANPGHVEMKKNLDFYRGTGAVPDHEFVDLEARPHLGSDDTVR